MCLQISDLLTDEPLAPLGPCGPCNEKIKNLSNCIQLIYSVECKWMIEWVIVLQEDQEDQGDREDLKIHRYPAIRWGECRSQLCIKETLETIYYCATWIKSEPVSRKLEYGDSRQTGGMKTWGQQMHYDSVLSHGNMKTLKCKLLVTCDKNELNFTQIGYIDNKMIISCKGWSTSKIEDHFSNLRTVFDTATMQHSSIQS